MYRFPHQMPQFWPLPLKPYSHHRLAWIHPFPDGNARVARLFTDAYFVLADLKGYGLWTGLPERTARDIVGALTRDGLLTSSSPKGPLRLAIPVSAAAYWFPHLFPQDVPPAAVGPA